MFPRLVAAFIAAMFYGSYRFVRDRNVVDCLRKEGLVIYGAKWCSHTNELQSDFGSKWKKITYVDCDENPAKCKSEGIRGYPTATLEKGPNKDFFIYPRTIDDIAKLSNCVPIFDRYKIGVGERRPDRTSGQERLPTSVK